MAVIGQFHAPDVFFPGKELRLNLIGVGLDSSDRGKTDVARM
jgi:hypothetical protein